jgi:uncharacterized membrane-anchored protein
MTSSGVRRAGTAYGLRHAATKVPEVTVAFWITKVLTTGMGEAASDYLVFHMNPELAVGLGFVAFVVALSWQYFRRTYSTWIYWLAVTMVAVFGTMCADVLHVRFGVPYAVSSTGFAVALALIFIAWYASERTLSIHSIYTKRREAFYWATVLATFALGTALGDLTATTLHLGYLASGVLFTVIIFIPAVAYRWLHLNAIAAFWFAYIVTRPLGASYADWMGVPHSRGGLGWGRGPVALGLSVLIVGLVAYMAMKGREATAQGPADPASRREPSYQTAAAATRRPAAQPPAPPGWPAADPRYAGPPPSGPPADPRYRRPPPSGPPPAYPERSGRWPPPVPLSGGPPPPGQPPLPRRPRHLPPDQQIAPDAPPDPPGQPARPPRPGRHRAPRDNQG